ncbi:22616_t:CDS:2 [Rhizophagus irregularis]|nr:22616_t:CDS:2 [Rhizophagus irregularis]
MANSTMCAKRGKNEAITQPFGTWQVDRSATKEVNGILPKLGIYDFHFQFNNKSSDKKLKSFETEIIQWRRWCTERSWHLNKQNIRVQCIGKYAYEALKVSYPLCTRAFDDIKRPKSICCLCYKKLEGHVYHRPVMGKKGTPLHLEDTSKGLKIWIIY